MTRWGFVGLGAMGEPMALRLAAAGIPLTVLHRHDAGRRAAAEAGAAIASGAAELAAASDVIAICVFDEAQVDRVLGGDGGLLVHCTPGTLLVLHTTMSPGAAVRIAGEAAEHGLGVIDAPVSGLPVRARTGELTIYVGGTQDDLERARSGLEAMATTILHMGTVGTGETAKLVGNLLSVGTIALAAEAIGLAVAAGIGQDAIERALQAGPADSFTLRQFRYHQEHWAHRGVAEGRGTIAEGLGAVLDLARRLGCRAPMAGAAISVLPQSLVIEPPASGSNVVSRGGT